MACSDHFWQIRSQNVHHTIARVLICTSKSPKKTQGIGALLVDDVGLIHWFLGSLIH